jgi:hypothetical protein
MGTPPIAPETDERITLLFAPADREKVRRALLEYCGDNLPGWSWRGHAEGIERIRTAVLKLSEGDMKNLTWAIDAARKDWRDVLVWAGFGNMQAHKTWWPEKK